MQKIKVKFIRKFNLKRIAIKSLIVLSLLLVVSVSCLYGANKFFDKNEFVFKSPIAVSLYTPISIQERVKDITVQIIENDGLPLTEDERYLCKKFGDQCKTALEIQRRENPKGQCDAFYVNKNKTIDIGFLQINSVHIDSKITLAELVDCKKNIDIAYDLYKKFGWGIWTTSAKL